ncbi:MAG: tRNA 5-hydroxyuridine modification protein YegQ [Thiotrichales bacterium]|jgi:putative protease|nr:tRNA 5-hydroxyuridine modification protein YegQ [Thiotrichales bacterium]
MLSTELLSPAGSLKSLRYAYAYGADAVYAGQPRYSLRVRNNEFDLDALATGINEAHAAGKKLYVVVNIAPHNSKLKTFVQDMKEVIDLKPDALIMSDPGLIMMVREAYPHIDIHLSVQANAVNWATVKFWQQQGLTRAILSRELSVEEIAEIRQAVPEMELEVFVHGALCIAYSGRCLLSGYMNKRDPNQGACTNSCRWKYDAHEAKETAEGDIVTFDPKALSSQPIQPTSGGCGSGSCGSESLTPIEARTAGDNIFLLEEANRPGELMPAFEDEHGTYIMNSKDLRAIEQVQRLIDIGVHSLKIEGRTKSHYYVARTAATYRAAIDAAHAGKGFDPQWLRELDGLANRGYTEGFLRRHRAPEDTQNYETGSSVMTHEQFAGEVIDISDSVITVDVKNHFRVGDTMSLLMPGNAPQTFVLREMLDKNGRLTEIASGSGHVMQIPRHHFPQLIESNALRMGLLVRQFG